MSTGTPSAVGTPFAEVPSWEHLPAGFTHGDVAGVAVDSDDNVYLQTRLDARVLVYNRDGKFLRSWGEGAFSNRPHGLAIGPDSTVYYVDESEHVVRSFDANGNELGIIGTPGVASDTGYDGSGGTMYAQAASVSRAAGPFNRPTGAAVANDGTLYISDGYGNSRIHHFGADGELLHSWGRPGSGPAEFRVPHAVTVLNDERVLVADRENDRIQVFGADGTFLETWADAQRPTAMAVGPDGLIYVAELSWWPGERSWTHGPVYTQKPGRISALDSRGNVEMRWPSGGDGRGPGEFIAPHCLAFDTRGDLYVGETAYSFTKSKGVESPQVNSFHKFSRR